MSLVLVFCRLSGVVVCEGVASVSILHELCFAISKGWVCARFVSCDFCKFVASAESFAPCFRSVVLMHSFLALAFAKA